MAARRARPLEATERRIAAHLRKLLGVHAPMPAMALVQAPVFHAHTFSIYIEMASAYGHWRFRPQPCWASMCRLRARRKILPAT